MEHKQAIQKFSQFTLYIITAGTMMYSGYGRLDFVARGIENLQFNHILAAWPVLFLFISIPLLVTSAFIGLGTPRRAAQIAFIGAILGWGYFIPSLCGGFLWASILIFISPLGFLQFFVPGVLLFLTTLYSRRTKEQRL